jgi:hypothetical protein
VDFLLQIADANFGKKSLTGDTKKKVVFVFNPRMQQQAWKPEAGANLFY